MRDRMGVGRDTLRGWRFLMGEWRLGCCQFSKSNNHWLLLSPLESRFELQKINPSFLLDWNRLSTDVDMEVFQVPKDGTYRTNCF